MKYIRTFENINENKPQIGNYVILKNFSPVFRELRSFLENNIGEIISIITMNKIDEIEVEYNNVPENLQSHFISTDAQNRGIKNIRKTSISAVIHHSKNKEELEQIILNNKFNI